MCSSDLLILCSLKTKVDRFKWLHVVLDLSNESVCLNGQRMSAEVWPLRYLSKIPNCRFQQTIKLYRICDVDYSIIVLYEMSTLFYYFFRYFFIFLQFIKNMYYLPKKASAITRSSGVVILIFSYFPVKTCTS